MFSPMSDKVRFSSIYYDLVRFPWIFVDNPSTSSRHSRLAVLWCLVFVFWSFVPPPFSILHSRRAFTRHPTTLPRRPPIVHIRFKISFSDFRVPCPIALQMLPSCP